MAATHGHVDPNWARDEVLLALDPYFQCDGKIPGPTDPRVESLSAVLRKLPEVIRTENGPEFAIRTMQTWAARNGIELRFIQPGKPVQNAYIESFSSRFRDACLSQHWFASLSHMCSVNDN